MPNPTNGPLTVRVSLSDDQRAILSLVSTQGTIVHENPLAGPATRTTIETSNLAQGIYILSLKTENGTWQKKVSVVK